MHDPDGVRLQKLLAAAGVGSRRVCEDLISQGRVQVDGQVVTELGVRIRATQTVHVDGVPTRELLAKEGRRQVQSLAAAWHPWSSVATWYLWRSLDPLPVEY